METSVLTSTKKALSIAPDDTSFDLDILTHINSGLSNVSQIGVIAPQLVEDEFVDWGSFNLSDDLTALLRTYIYVYVRLLFDPPGTSFHIDALKEQRDENLIRMSYLREDDTVMPVSDGDIDYANGTQATPSTIWIMNHNLGYNPAAFRFFDEDGNELEPVETNYPTLNRAIATWPEAISGTWMVS